eukprot:gnl/TRDRNA2_/TRDRNA2_175856_c0_seq1.p2 gnl/TRDRNA2_/TRDRNA2_175856_c0~~gnl/TRDRNA2_/TRDRNA2_175856_c0_seq1.p2  ORF type:complete len:259 (+),score=44.95 gnl/TRDRNA2_/TRDRNA2_175856_c0_seq1:70-777(+)
MPQDALLNELEVHRALLNLKRHQSDQHQYHSYKDFRAAREKEGRMGNIYHPTTNQIHGLTEGAFVTHRGDKRNRVKQKQNPEVLANVLENSEKKRAWHPMMDVIEKYRLPQDVRVDIVRSVFKDKVERWWKRYKEYKLRKMEFAVEWQQWRVTITMHGKDRPEKWPKLPQIPRYPYEFTSVDPKMMRERVMAALRNTPAAQLLPQDDGDGVAAAPAAGAPHSPRAHTGNRRANAS